MHFLKRIKYSRTQRGRLVVLHSTRGLASVYVRDRDKKDPEEHACKRSDHAGQKSPIVIIEIKVSIESFRKGALFCMC
jgi:hypothetical protein